MESIIEKENETETELLQEKRAVAKMRANFHQLPFAVIEDSRGRLMIVRMTAKSSIKGKVIETIYPDQPASDK